MSDSLVFVLAPLAALPEGPVARADLEAAQRLGPRGGFALRLFTAADAGATAIRSLPLDGQLDPAAGQRKICDAVIPQLEPRLNGLGVYRSTPGSEQLECLDRFALSDANNETCWFYPTHDGTFLSWERALVLALAPGAVAAAEAAAPTPYARNRVSVLWSLLADDESLTCVGITYGGQRIEWPLLDSEPEPLATWSLFTVQAQAAESLVIEDSHTVLAEG
ncbi:MAG: hypothetical protein EBX49_01320 [Synechococcaceae bacterium WB8_1B_136]|nr:hypothetical protein [Synechococcaceae bacterium WB8_1B_136]